MKGRFIFQQSIYIPGCVLFLILLLVLFTGGCGESDLPADDSDRTLPAAASPESVFAHYRLQPVTITPSIDPPAVAEDLSNVYIPMALSETQRARLVRDGFVASPGLQEKEFFTLYEKARYDNVPVFITSDSMLHVYHLLFSKTLRTAEAEYFHPLLKDLNKALSDELDTQYQALRGTPWEDAALHTAAFVAVAGNLADPSFAVPAYTSDLVNTELTQIEAAEGMLPSAVFPEYLLGEDYTQYIPRGHYTKSDALKAYFKSMMWYGRMTFRLSSEDETRSALLLLQAMRNTRVNGTPALAVWADLYNPTAFLVGRSDDLTAFDFIPLVDEVYGLNPTLESLTDDDIFPVFISAARELPSPQILGLSVLEAEELSDVKGLRFMGQRFVPDAYIFYQLTYDRVSDIDKRRGLPMGLDLFAAMGSERAYALLDQMGETGYLGYPEQMEKMRRWTASLTAADWTETVNNAWLYSFYPLLETPGEGYPHFMYSTAWLDKQLHTCHGSWAELKHDTILYAKQSYAEMGDGWYPTPPDPLPARGYVEPVPELFARLAALAAMTREGLAERSLLNEQDANSLEQIEYISLELKRLAEKQLQVIALTEDEHEWVRYYGGWLEQLVMASADVEDDEFPGAGDYMDEDPQAAVIADVATDVSYSGEDFSGMAVLEVGVGRINEIHVVVPLVEEDGSIRLQVAKGGIFSYYEFPWPASDRLTDEKWQEMLDEGKAPAPPAWVKSFFTFEGEFHELQQYLYGFQRAWVEAVYFLSESYVSSDYYQLAGGTALELIKKEVSELQAKKQFEGRQLIGCDYRSFDRQSANLIVVTVRETWQDSLYRYEGSEHPAESHSEDDMIEINRRGPYTMDMTYTLERDEADGWIVTRIVTTDLRPSW